MNERQREGTEAKERERETERERERERRRVSLTYRRQRPDTLQSAVRKYTRHAFAYSLSPSLFRTRTVIRVRERARMPMRGVALRVIYVNYSCGQQLLLLLYTTHCLYVLDELAALLLSGRSLLKINISRDFLFIDSILWRRDWR